MIKILKGHVYHARVETAQNVFKYPIFNLYFSTNEYHQLKQLLAVKFKKTIGLDGQSYLDTPQSDVAEKIKKFVAERFQFQASVHYDDVILQTIPKMFGYVFNPVSFWYFFRQCKLTAVLCEVNNTFGERHYYWLTQGTANDLTDCWLQAEKQFHVSPFFDREGRYEFKFKQNETSIEAHIKYLTDQGETRLITWVKGELSDLQNTTLTELLLHYGWMTPLVVLRIHLQAVKLWFKKVKFFSKPQPLQKGMTYGELKNDVKNSQS